MSVFTLCFSKPLDNAVNFWGEEGVLASCAREQQTVSWWSIPRSARSSQQQRDVHPHVCQHNEDQTLNPVPTQCREGVGSFELAVA